MSGAPLFNHRGDTLLLFLQLPHRLPQINQPICQLPVQLANEWVPEDLPAGPLCDYTSATARAAAATHEVSNKGPNLQ